MRAEAEALYFDARALMRAGQNRDALPVFARVQTMDPEFGDAAEAYAEGLDRSGKSDLATSLYDSHRQQQASKRGAPPDRCFVLQRVGRLTTEAAEYSRLALSAGIPVEAYIYIARGSANLAMGKPLAALVDYSAALGCNPELVEPIALQGEALSMMGRYDEALLAFDRAIAKRPNDPYFLGGRALVQLALGHTAQAIADWRRQFAALSLERASARACVALRMGDYMLARPELDRALELEPGNTYWQLYRLTTARRIGEPFVIRPPSPSNNWPSPLLELQAGRVSAAEALRCANNSQRMAEAQFQIGVLALAACPDQARVHFEQVLELTEMGMIEYAAACHELARWKKL